MSQTQFQADLGTDVAIGVATGSAWFLDQTDLPTAPGIDGLAEVVRGLLSTGETRVADWHPRARRRLAEIVAIGVLARETLGEKPLTKTEVFHFIGAFEAIFNSACHTTLPGTP